MTEGAPKRPERLGKAPIVEALIDIHVVPVLSKLEQLAAFEAVAQAEFPERKRVIELRGNLDFSSDEPKVTSSAPEVRGFAFWTADKRRVVQARLNGFSFSHLAPYDRWASLRDDTQTWWSKFCEATTATEVTRVAVRYINRIDLPLPIRDFGDYLRTLPVVAQGLPQSLSGFFMRLVMPIEGATVIITQTIDEAAVTASLLPVVLDIDVFESNVVPATGDALWDKIENLRRIKNEVFFGSLTPAAWRLFE